MKTQLLKTPLLLAFIAACAVCGCVTTKKSTTAPVTVTLDPAHPGAAIPADFTGLSFEVSQLLPNANGVHYFRADNKPLITLFQTLGVKSLRIGGNSSDRDVKRLPSDADFDSLFAFARAANVKIIYCLRLHDGDPEADAQTVKYIMDHYADQMDCFSIGQEPSAYPKTTNSATGAVEKYTYSEYAADWKKFADAIIAAVPDVKICGPSVHNDGIWAVNFIDDFGKLTNVVLVTEHLYPGGSETNVTILQPGIDRMLAADWLTNYNKTVTNWSAVADKLRPFPEVYQKLYDSFVPECVSNGLPYRLEEVNNYYNGGAANVSDSFASALWGLDFMHWWAAHGCAGLNFHTGDKVSANNAMQGAKYTAFFSTTNGFNVRPLGYGIKAFDLGGRGTNLPVMISNPDNLNLSAYAVAGGGGNLYLTFINKEHGAGARAAEITINLNPGDYKYAEMVSLTAPHGDVTNKIGITLGGAAIQPDGNWDGKWTPLDKPALEALRKGVVRLKIPAASALVLFCMKPNYAESEIGTFTLPDPLELQNGNYVQTANDWLNYRRPEILRLYLNDIYGHSPTNWTMRSEVRETDDHALGGKAIRKQIDLEFFNPPSTNSIVFHVLLYTPADAKKPVPTFLGLSFSPNYADVKDPGVIVYPSWDKKDNKLVMPEKIERGTSHSWPIDEILARGYGLAVLDYNDIEPDFADGTGWRYGVRSLYLRPDAPNHTPHDWGAISAWAWGASRVLDYLQTDPDVDPQRVIFVGQSRLGKTAMWVGAENTNFAMVIASCSGEMGAALSRRDFGETVTSMCHSYAYQFCGNFLAYSNRIDHMPVDSHMLISLIAPRPLYLNTGSLDRWSDPHGEFEAAIAAAPVYRLFGEQSVVTKLPAAPRGGGSGAVLESSVLQTYTPPPLDIPIFHDIGFQTHTGPHDILAVDWERFLDFADMHFYGKPPHQYPAKK
ncbi:MAG TPA: glycosyl hydrolase family 79 C-terminal domain-containing protein [Verrucomicrobiae bacterium]|nr:glycosyl hydrolase family 79 C-terminal domain-containing protein [Verrucomicrobiae bacterium]